MEKHPELRKVNLAELSNIQCEFFLGGAGAAANRTVLVVRFRGNYRPGSAGEPDARFMFAMLQAGFEAWECWAVILDLSDLIYEWGDDIEGLWAIRPSKIWDYEYPLAMIVGAESERALASLYYGSPERASFSESWVFNDLSVGWKYLENELAKI